MFCLPAIPSQSFHTNAPNGIKSLMPFKSDQMELIPRETCGQFPSTSSSSGTGVTGHSKTSTL